jgi:hypothetical protein
MSLLIEARRGLPSRGECWRGVTQDLLDEAESYAVHIDPLGMNHEELEAEFLNTYRMLRREVDV